jgi:uncharacterized protein YjbJ (UPF0337 family)
MMDNKDQAKGKIKQAVGDLTGNKDLKREGKTDEKAGNVKAAVKELDGKVQHLVDTTMEKLTKN